MYHRLAALFAECLEFNFSLLYMLPGQIFELKKDSTIYGLQSIDQFTNIVCKKIKLFKKQKKNGKVLVWGLKISLDYSRFRC